MKRFTQIKGLSDIRRLPRLGKIRGGIKVKNKQGKEYPKETPHFVVPAEVAKVYGDQPLELDVMFPLNDRATVFPQAYEFYGASRGLKCTGDGETAMRYDEEQKCMVERECPCELLEEGKCKQRGHLMVLLPKVSVGGIYQIDTSSYNSIVDLNSSLDYVESILGRFAMVPLKLKREPRETHHDGKKQMHYTLRAELEGDIDFINKLKQDTTRVLEGPTYKLPAPVHENAALDPVDEVEEEPEPEQQDKPQEQAPYTEAELVAETKKAIEHGNFERVNELSDVARSMGDEVYQKVQKTGIEHMRKIKSAGKKSGAGST